MQLAASLQCIPFPFRTLFPNMSHSFVGTTLALQHYYDIVDVSRKLPLLTIYQAHEQPFGQRMAIWMANYGGEIPVTEETQKRLDDTLLKNRAVNDSHVLRVLDYGTSEGFSFVVTDAIDDMITLRAWLRTHGALASWQTLRLLEQLVGIIQSAHQAGFSYLCLTSDNIFIKDTERFEIVTGPLGMGLHRAEILNLHEVPVTAELMRHIPPWEYGIPYATTSKSPQIQKDASIPQSPHTEAPQSHSAPEPASSEPSPSDPSSKEDLASQLTSEERSLSKTENSDIAPASNVPSDSDHSNDVADAHDSIQNLLLEAEHIETDHIDAALDIPPQPDNACADTYNLACVLYETLCGQHPYFNDERDLCDAAFTIIQATPPDISKRVEISDDINDVVMHMLKSPQEDALHRVLHDFAACCSPEEREKAREADKIWLKPTKTTKTQRRKLRTKVKIKHPLAWILVILALFIGLTATLTWHIASYKTPVDLFALPELIPAVPNGIDVVLAPRSIPPETSVFLTSHADGTLIKLGTLPFIYRQQAPDTHLTFVIADDHGHSMQVPVTVKGDNGLMLVPVDLNW